MSKLSNMKSVNEYNVFACIKNERFHGNIVYILNDAFKFIKPPFKPRSKVVFTIPNKGWFEGPSNLASNHLQS